MREGFAADLLLVRCDLLADITLLPDPANLLMVMKGGVFHKAPPPVEIQRREQPAA